MDIYLATKYNYETTPAALFGKVYVMETACPEDEVVKAVFDFLKTQPATHEKTSYCQERELADALPAALAAAGIEKRPIGSVATDKKDICIVMERGAYSAGVYQVKYRVSVFE